MLNFGIAFILYFQKFHCLYFSFPVDICVMLFSRSKSRSKSRPSPSGYMSDGNIQISSSRRHSRIFRSRSSMYSLSCSFCRLFGYPLESSNENFEFFSYPFNFLRTFIRTRKLLSDSYYSIEKNSSKLL